MTLIELAYGVAPAGDRPRVEGRDIRMTVGPDEAAIANLVGDIRNNTARRAGNPVAAQTPSERKRRGPDPVGSELVVSRLLDRYPNCFRGYPSDNSHADVGPYQVRNARSPYLKLYPPGNPRRYQATNPEQIYILTIGELPRYRVVGWLRARDGMRDEFSWTDDFYGRHWRVPADRLHSFPIAERTI